MEIKVSELYDLQEAIKKRIVLLLANTNASNILCDNVEEVFEDFMQNL